ncbi:phage holin [Oceanobacillus saliphilus]|uniref:phage holin n=1 Tax=Oceanobacillus saliphilus TaxID=2925834 RepID=UPI00201E330F
MDKSSLIRTILLAIALVNQVAGTVVIALNEQHVSTIVDGVYLLISTLITVFISIVTWFKNNYVTEKGLKQKNVLQQNKLIK